MPFNPAPFQPPATPSAYKASTSLSKSGDASFSVSTTNGQVYSAPPNLLAPVPQDVPTLLARKGRFVVSLGVGGFTNEG